MQPLDTIETACRQALQDSGQNGDWQAAYCDAVPPAVVLGLIAQLKATVADGQDDNHTALLRLVRDLTGYIRLATGDKPDAVRDDLLLQARELVTQPER